MFASLKTYVYKLQKTLLDAHVYIMCYGKITKKEVNISLFVTIKQLIEFGFANNYIYTYA
jgi:hypothetical protein